jgi:DNA-binding SARP family transcriptional activator
MGTRIRLCGRLEVELDGRRVERRLPGRQGPLVFALLVLNRDRPVARDELIGALWPGAPPADPDEALSAVLSKVRQAVGRETLTGGVN